MNNKLPESIRKKLTEREQQILLQVLEGYSNSGVADSLYITINTVKKHIRNILQKLDDRDSEGGAGGGVPRKPLPNDGGNMGQEELASLLSRYLAD